MKKPLYYKILEYLDIDSIYLYRSIPEIRQAVGYERFAVLKNCRMLSTNGYIKLKMEKDNLHTYIITEKGKTFLTLLSDIYNED